MNDELFLKLWPVLFIVALVGVAAFLRTKSAKTKRRNKKKRA